MAFLESLVATSERVSASASRLVKTQALAECLAGLPPDVVEIAVLYLSGALPQGRIGVGYRA